MTRSPFLPETACPRCGRQATTYFVASGVCPHCVGTRLLALVDTDSDPGMLGAAARSDLAQIGPYLLIDELGRGGMGTVYLAQHMQLGTLVALKAVPLVGPGRGELELRFLREARTAARLRHPHIVAVHDAGRDAGHVYFTMDYIEGGDLAHRLRLAVLPLPAAASFVHQAAVAIAYSHAEGVLHRDLKPSNILLHGDVVRVADFGLASEVENSAHLTAHPTVLGTPHYLAPESLLRGSAAQSPAVDIYALGVILFEALTGRTPLAGAAPGELSGLLAQRIVPPLRLLAPHVPRDLDTICRKCLEFEAARRYASAADLAEDLRRFLAGESIVARPVPAWTQAWRWARRRPAIAAVWVLAFSLLVGSFATTFALHRARTRTAEQAATSQALADFLQHDILAQASPNAQLDRDVSLRTVLDQAADKISGHFPANSLVAADLRDTIAANYHALGDFAGEHVQLCEAWTIRDAVLGPEAEATLSTESQLAGSFLAAGELEDARRHGRHAAAGLVRTVGWSHAATLRALIQLVVIETQLGHYDFAESLGRRILAIARTGLGPDSTETRLATSALSSVLWASDQSAEAEELALQALDQLQRALGPEHPDTLSALSDLGTIYWNQSRLTEAESLNLKVLEIRRRVLGPDHPETLRSVGNLATTYASEGKFAAAVTLHEELLTSRRNVLGPDHPDTLLAEHNLTLAQFHAGAPDQALALARETYSRANRVLGPDHPTALTYAGTLAGMLVRLGQLDEGIAIATSTYAAQNRVFGPTSSRSLFTAQTLGEALMKKGRLAEAEMVWREVVDRRASDPTSSWRTAAARVQLADVLRQRQELPVAEAQLLLAFDVLSQPGLELPETGRRALVSCRQALSTIYLAEGRPEEAARWQSDPVSSR